MMDEYKPLSELWRENGEKPIDVEIKNYQDHYKVFGKSPNNRYAAYNHTNTFFKANELAKLHKPEPKKAVYRRAIFETASRYFCGETYYKSKEDVIQNYRRFGCDDYEFDEWLPGSEIERPELESKK